MVVDYFFILLSIRHTEKRKTRRSGLSSSNRMLVFGTKQTFNQVEEHVFFSNEGK